MWPGGQSVRPFGNQPQPNFPQWQAANQRMGMLPGGFPRGPFTAANRFGMQVNRSQFLPQHLLRQRAPRPQVSVSTGQPGQRVSRNAGLLVPPGLPGRPCAPNQLGQQWQQTQRLPTQMQPMPRQPMHRLAMQGQPVQRQPVQRQPVQRQAMLRQYTPRQSMPWQAMPRQLVQRQAMPGQPTARQLTPMHPTAMQARPDQQMRRHLLAGQVFPETGLPNQFEQLSKTPGKPNQAVQTAQANPAWKPTNAEVDSRSPPSATSSAGTADAPALQQQQPSLPAAADGGDQNAKRITGPAGNVPAGNPESGMGVDNGYPGNWDCPRCNVQNFANMCRQCKLPQPTQNGKWECPRCRTSNSMEVSCCKECHLVKQAPTAPRPQRFSAPPQTVVRAPYRPPYRLPCTGHNRPAAPASEAPNGIPAARPRTTEPVRPQSEAAQAPLAPGDDHGEPSDKEKQFDAMFHNWEAQFEAWKEENMNNPDQGYVMAHIQNMNAMGEKMLERRDKLRRQRHEASNVEDAAQKPHPEDGPDKKGHSQGIPGLGDGQDPPEKHARETAPSTNDTGEPPAKVMKKQDDLPHSTPGKHPGPPAQSKPYVTSAPSKPPVPPHVLLGNVPNPPAHDDKSHVPPAPDRASDLPAHGKRRPGDWDCSRCFQQNFAFRIACKFCQASKDQSDSDAVSSQAGNSGELPVSEWPSWYPAKVSDEHFGLGQRWDDASSNEADLFSRRDDLDDPVRGRFGSTTQHLAVDHAKWSGDGKAGFNYSAKVVDYGHGSSTGNSSGRRGEENLQRRQEPSRSLRETSHHGRDEGGSARDRRSTRREEKPRRIVPAETKLPTPPRVVPAKPASPQGERIAVDDLLQPPGRYMRPPKLVVILRGLPGSGKSYIAKHIKTLESQLGSEAPRILALDDYFECDGSYEYEEEMEPSYRSSLIKSFKKQVDDGYFSFIIVDCINDKTEHYQAMWSYAKQKGFEVYVGEVDVDVGMCASRNVHKRTGEDIDKISKRWEPMPSYLNRVDFSGFLQDKAIDQVEMEDVSTECEEEQQPQDKNDDDTENPSDQLDSAEGASAPFQLSKWELMDREERMAQLDGVSQKAIKKLAEQHSSINDWLEISTQGEEDGARAGKKKVRWADVEERKQQSKMRDIGFVVGHTNWNRLMDPTDGGSALTKTKIIPNRFQSE